MRLMSLEHSWQTHIVQYENVFQLEFSFDFSRAVPPFRENKAKSLILESTVLQTLQVL